MDVLEPLLLEYPEHIRTYEPSLTQKLRSYGNATAKKKDKVAPSKPKPIVEVVPEIKVSSELPQPMPQEKKYSGDASNGILAVLKGDRPLTVDEIAALTGLDITKVMTELTMMEIDGSVISCVGGRFISSKF